MKLSKLNQQSGGALIGVMALLVLSMVLLPQIMNRSAFVASRGVGQAIQIKNVVMAEEVSQMLHASIAEFPATDSNPGNFVRYFPDANFSTAACESDPCLKRLSAPDVNLCTPNRFTKVIPDPSGKKTITLFACRNDSTEINGVSPSCVVTNNAKVAEMRLYACVYDQGTNGQNMAVSVWSYLYRSNKFLKVEENIY